MKKIIILLLIVFSQNCFTQNCIESLLNSKITGYKTVRVLLKKANREKFIVGKSSLKILEHNKVFDLYMGKNNEQKSSLILLYNTPKYKVFTKIQNNILTIGKNQMIPDVIGTLFIFDKKTFRLYWINSKEPIGSVLKSKSINYLNIQFKTEPMVDCLVEIDSKFMPSKSAFCYKDSIGNKKISISSLMKKNKTFLRKVKLYNTNYNSIFAIPFVEIEKFFNLKELNYDNEIEENGDFFEMEISKFFL